MPKTSKTFKIITGSALALTLVVAGGASVSAATETRTKPMDSLVTAIATRFNLNTADVQKVFEENRTTREQERLNAAVTAGALTQAQANLIIAKRAELEASHEAKRATLSTLTEAERKSAMSAERASLQTWMTANNIPKEFMMMGGGHGGPRGEKMPTTK